MMIQSWWKWFAPLLVYSEANIIPNVTTTMSQTITQDGITVTEILTSDWTAIEEEYEDISNSSTMEEGIIDSTLLATSGSFHQHSKTGNNTNINTTLPSNGTPSQTVTSLSSSSESMSTGIVSSTEQNSIATIKNTTIVFNFTLPPSTAEPVPKVNIKADNITSRNSTENNDPESGTVNTTDTDIENKDKEINTNKPARHKDTLLSRTRVINNIAVWITAAFVVIICSYIIGLVVCNRQRTEWRLQLRRYVRFENGTEPEFQADRDCYNQTNCGTNIFTEEEKYN
ncbi:uncharacterized protein LOC117114720 [Anneissia japonica]|uniref:uncharacterized protein LOC117114720 n=1 Tax=Anneissia japonica TaxID=1529436 RepID=UPI001425892D|nr:uncharacterized protein LOC117114720 [Anneissia japonica]